MEKITLEQVDEVRRRAGVSYKEAKEALEFTGGDPLEAVIYLEENGKAKTESIPESGEKETLSVDDVKKYITELIEKGNVSRIKVRKDEKELLNIPVNAGIAAGIIAVVIPQILVAGVIAAVATKITIEITFEDGSVEVVNKYVSEAAHTVKDKAAEAVEKFKSSDIADKVKNKVNEVKEEVKKSKDYEVYQAGSKNPMYSYTVNFDDEEEENNTTYATVNLDKNEADTYTEFTDADYTEADDVKVNLDKESDNLNAEEEIKKEDTEKTDEE